MNLYMSQLSDLSMYRTSSTCNPIVVDLHLKK